MARHKKLLSVGLPTNLAALRLILGTLEPESPADCIVRNSAGQLVVEQPVAELPLDEPPI